MHIFQVNTSVILVPISMKQQLAQNQCAIEHSSDYFLIKVSKKTTSPFNFAAYCFQKLMICALKTVAYCFNSWLNWAETLKSLWPWTLQLTPFSQEPKILKESQVSSVCQAQLSEPWTPPLAPKQRGVILAPGPAQGLTRSNMTPERGRTDGADSLGRRTLRKRQSLLTAPERITDQLSSQADVKMTSFSGSMTDFCTSRADKRQRKLLKRTISSVYN